ncbi:unnamed protein product [Clonostachys solani]|uniref:Uncharacterized protein n=1 Tax=Clonostachys solani TaxID=160281 RepID=A0A9N9ZK43_9HYPO|nr:unnamed protein product [Clonostachys solani]
MDSDSTCSLSDILTEVDEFSSDTILSDHSSNLVAILSSNSPEVIRPPVTSPSQATVNNEIESNSDGVLWLRSHMNKILSLYTPIQAYARPHQLKDLVFGLGEDLRMWYQSLPMERQFPRDIMTFTVHGASFQLDNYWPEYQLLFASYLILLQVRTRTSLEPYLRILGDMDRLLDMVEEVFRTKTYQEPLIQKSLVLLVDARHNLDNSSLT